MPQQQLPSHHVHSCLHALLHEPRPLSSAPSATQLRGGPLQNFNIKASYRHPFGHGRPLSQTFKAAQESDAAAPTNAAKHSKQADQQQQQYRYIGSNNRRHATMEDAWSVGPDDENQLDSASSFGGENVPWGLGWQSSERNLVWNDTLRLGLLKVTHLSVICSSEASKLQGKSKTVCQAPVHHEHLEHACANH